MTTKKPKTALAKLLDNIKQMDLTEAEGLNISEMKAPAYSVISEVSSNLSDTPNINTTSEQNLNSLQLCYIDPQKCKPWKFADRPEDEMGDINQLAFSIKEHGQQEPVLVRAVHNNELIQFEIIFGNRRWRACQQANIKMLAIVKQVSDQEAALYQKEENEQRKDLSDLARARSYRLQLEAGVFNSESEMSTRLNISRKTLNDLMAFIRIPPQLVDAIPNFKHISRAMAVKLSILAKDKVLLDKLIELGPKIGNKQIGTTNIEKFLMADKPQKPAVASLTQVNDHHGNLLFNIRKDQRGLTIIKIAKHLSEKYEILQLKEMLYKYFSGSHH